VWFGLIWNRNKLVECPCRLIVDGRRGLRMLVGGPGPFAKEAARIRAGPLAKKTKKKTILRRTLDIKSMDDFHDAWQVVSGAP